MASTEKTTALKGKGLEAGSAALVVESHLPQPLEDDAIASELTKLKILIKNHVQSYYHLSAVDASQIAADTRTIEAALPGTALTPSRLAQFIANPTSRYAALRLAIAWVVISNVDVMSPPETTLLPPAVAKCVETMTGMEGNEEARMAFLSKWCSITSTLMKPTYSRNPFSSSDPRNHNIAKAVDALEALLRPYASDRVSISERRTNLEEIVRRGASFAFLLFSQPSFFTFEWEEQNGTEAGSLVVFPAMLQVADEAAVPLARPRVFGDMEVVRRLA
ncbi:hypothetical protein M501DRAFT_929646 [Patellaria atrata CBS 101060]|uniref:Uncharacterized protein n=1 Tax=Patellaria atrata CBS 101060 TaxID=1346257 RepID=A0A9P4VPY5_9PEZI|nr:hypothetical protein M501DRAFT_929646 [Patellaria atrata CBS 101060]